MKIKRVQTYELINMEGPLLIFELHPECGIFIFPDELSNTRVHREDIINYLIGHQDIKSPKGKVINMMDEKWTGMLIDRNIEAIIKQVSE